MDDSAFREDALRQWSAARAVCGPRAGERRSGIRRHRACDRRLAGARDARGGRHVLVEPRCRQRRPRGQVLCLDPRRDSRATLNAYLDDYAYLLSAVIEVMQTRFRRQDFDLARALADALLTRFEDRKNGGFWFTSHDHEKLFHRTKPGRDGATPSGNGVAAQALIVLGHLANDSRYLDAAERTVRLFAPTLAQAPSGYATLLTALEDLEAPPTSVLLAGDTHDADAWHAALERQYRPNVRAL